MGAFKDLKNKKFGRLTVLELDDIKSTSKTKQWICRCDCGKILSVASCHLISGHSKSCGCLNKEINSKSNRIEFDNNYGCLRVYFNNCDEYFLCDLEDKDIAEKYCWYKDSNGYVIGWERGHNKSIKLHRLIMSKYYNIEGYMIDHQNHNKLDNRKCNLRICTSGENQRNIRSSSDINHRGIYYEKERNKYVLTIRYNGKPKKWRFDTLDQAITYRDNFYLKHPDEYRYNFDEDYQNRKDNPNIICPFIFINTDKI